MKTNWLLIGDIHGSTAPIKQFYEENNERLNLDGSDNRIILLGDVGMNYYLNSNKEQMDMERKERFCLYPFTYICLRGNHEPRVKDVVKKFPDRWTCINKYGGTVYVEKEFPNIEYLDDGPEVYEFAGYKTLSLPGAYSVDKHIRLMSGNQWFKNEQLTKEEQEYGYYLVGEHGYFDLIISHTCPYSFEPRELFLAGYDQAKIDKSMEYFLENIEGQADYRRWAFGHFHDNKLYPFKDGKEMLMLACSKVIDLEKFMEMNEYQYFDDIEA